MRSGATSGGKITRCVVPSRQGVFNSPNSPSRIALHTRIGQCRADEGAKLFQRLALVGSAAYGDVRAETLHVGAQPTTYTTSWDSNPPSPSPQ